MKNKKYEDYYRRYKNLIIRIAMDKTGNYDDAQDICQQVFVAFYLNMDIVPDELVKVWLIKCARHAISDYYRKVSREKETVMEFSGKEIGNVAIDGGIGLAEERLDDLNLLGTVLRTVKDANQQWFEVLFMYCIEGLSYAEMARRLGVSNTVLRARLYRARLFVKEKFGVDYRDR